MQTLTKNIIEGFHYPYTFLSPTVAEASLLFRLNKDSKEWTFKNIANALLFLLSAKSDKDADMISNMDAYTAMKQVRLLYPDTAESTITAALGRICIQHLGLIPTASWLGTKLTQGLELMETGSKEIYFKNYDCDTLLGICCCHKHLTRIDGLPDVYCGTGKNLYGIILEELRGILNNRMHKTAGKSTTHCEWCKPKTGPPALSAFYIFISTLTDTLIKYSCAKCLSDFCDSVKNEYPGAVILVSPIKGGTATGSFTSQVSTTTHCATPTALPKDEWAIITVQGDKLREITIDDS